MVRVAYLIAYSQRSLLLQRFRGHRILFVSLTTAAASRLPLLWLLDPKHS